VKVDRLLQDRDERLRLQKENQALRVENTYLKEEAEARYGEIVGESAAMREIFRWIERVARSDSTVMLYGESGTGKELVARAIHARSARAEGPFVRVNSGALAESLLDSELFGHEKGAFTGAERRRRGRFELADGGTLFLDEIATIPATTQVRLLRVLQERELERVGGEETIPVDVRIIAATNTPAEKLLANEHFREDLYYRLHVVPITLPPLRERRGDIPPLVQHFIEKLRSRTCTGVRTVSVDALEVLAGYDWPGNVRELENVVERALIMAEGTSLGVAHLPPLRAGAPRELLVPEAQFPAGGTDLTRMVEGVEERLLRQALEQASGVKAEAARLLGIKPSALYYKLEKYGIEA
jgi:two-component system response regulator HydG